ncbi:MAG: metal ABC transporter permease [Ktedonobacterales bacterium]
MPDAFMLASAPTPSYSWDLVADWQFLFQYEFSRNAFLAGTFIAVVAGAVGYFVVLRHLSFASHALADIGFAGAAWAVLLGLPAAVGLLVFAGAGALGIGTFGKRLRNRDVVIGTLLAWSLGLGTLFIFLYKGYAENAYAILFGQILGVSSTDVTLVIWASLVALVALAAIYRPLLFASLDADVAEARGVPVGALSLVFMLILAVAVAVAVQVIGVLLIFALLITPAAIAERITTRPAINLGIAAVLALLFTWAGLIVAYVQPYPVSVFITSFAFGVYVLVRLLTVRRPVLFGSSAVVQRTTGLEASS